MSEEHYFTLIQINSSVLSIKITKNYKTNEFQTILVNGHDSNAIMRSLYKPKVGSAVQQEEFIKEREKISNVVNIVIEFFGIDGKISKNKLVDENFTKMINEKFAAIIFKDILKALHVKEFLTQSQARESIDEYYIIDVIHET